MKNAKEELLKHIQNFGSSVKFVSLSLDKNGYGDNDDITYYEGPLVDVLDQLDFEYDAGFGSQHLFGTIWYDNNNWSDRAEYDGCERWKYNQCWAYNQCPDLPASHV